MAGSLPSDLLLCGTLCYLIASVTRRSYTTFRQVSGLDPYTAGLTQIHAVFMGSFTL